MTIRNKGEMIEKIMNVYHNSLKEEVEKIIELSVAIKCYLYDEYDSNNIVEDIIHNYYTDHYTSKGYTVSYLDTKEIAIAYYEGNKIIILTDKEADTFAKKENIY